MKSKSAVNLTVKGLVMFCLAFAIACQANVGEPTNGENISTSPQAEAVIVTENPSDYPSPSLVDEGTPEVATVVDNASIATVPSKSPAGTVPGFGGVPTPTQSQTPVPTLLTPAAPEATSAPLPTSTPRPPTAAESGLPTALAPATKPEPIPTSTAEPISGSEPPYQFTPAPQPVININFPDNATELHKAAVDVGPEAIREILDSGVDVNARISITITVEDTETVARDVTALHLAMWRNSDVAVTEVLLDYGADINAQGWRRAPIHFAAQYGGASLIELVLSRGADVNALDSRNATPLHYGARHNSFSEVIYVLLKSGADVHARTARTGHSPLHWAARNANAEITKLLVEHGADVHARTERGYSTPLHLAARFNPNPAVIQLLLEKGADVHARAFAEFQPDLGPTSLHLAARYNANPEIIEVLLNHGANINARGDAREVPELGPTPLHWAVRYNANPEVSGVLADRGADLDAEAELQAGNMGTLFLTPAELATQKTDPSIAERLGLAGG